MLRDKQPYQPSRRRRPARLSEARVLTLPASFARLIIRVDAQAVSSAWSGAAPTWRSVLDGWSVAHIAARWGFGDAASFSRAFKSA